MREKDEEQEQKEEDGNMVWCVSCLLGPHSKYTPGFKVFLQTVASGNLLNSSVGSVLDSFLY